jgi:hypothetical protein
MPPAERLVRLLLAAARVVPPRFALWLGGLLGDLVGQLPHRDVKRAREHLALAYPGQDAAWCARTARRCFRHFGRMALWTLATAHADPRRLGRGVAVEGRGNWRAIVRACRSGQGTMGMAGHLGNWELLARVAAVSVPLTVIGRRLRWPLADRLVWESRTSGGAHLVYQDADVRETIRELRAGRYVATLPDQDIPRLAGVHVPWFGLHPGRARHPRPARRRLGPARLLLPASARRPALALGAARRAARALPALRRPRAGCARDHGLDHGLPGAAGAAHPRAVGVVAPPLAHAGGSIDVHADGLTLVS